MGRRWIAALAGIWLAVLATAALAQDLASLVADRVEVEGNSRLIARGHVEVFYQGRRLRASTITYERPTDRLEIEGPIVMEDTDGSFILADQASLAADLTEGVLQSARLVLNQQLQLASNQLMRVGGRYTVLSKAVASSCKVCAGNPVPLWEIRASRVVHDEQERQIYFNNATLRMAGVPVMYLPRLRIPDPSLKRAAGFLTPQLRANSGLGYGVKVPYFIPLGDSRDLTLTPFFSTKSGRTLEARYRQAFRTGEISVQGALSFDDLRPGRLRGYGLAKGDLLLPRDFRLTFSLEVVSDPAYLLDYNISQNDRIDSRIAISRTRREEYISARLLNYNSIRAGEVAATLPSFIGDFTYNRRFRPDILGGEGGIRFQNHAHFRTSTSGADSDGDGISDGRDLGRSSLRFDWRRNWILPAGIIGTTLGELTADFYSIGQDAVFQGQRTRLHGAAGVELRWPWVRAEASGASQVIGPVVQLVWSPKDHTNLPNEDSVLVEFDEGNLFSLNRFPGSDAVEQGLRANVGLSWTRIAAEGWSLGVTAGRVLRTRDPDQFGIASGLDGMSSDWLAAMQIGLDSNFLITNRLLFDDDLDVTKAEMRLGLNRDRYGLNSSYIYFVADPTENRSADISELTGDGSYKVTPFWTAKFSGHYDLEANRATRAGLGLQFRNECLQLDLSLSRRFTSSSSVAPTTDFGLSVDLLGFGSGTAAGPTRTCRR